MSNNRSIHSLRVYIPNKYNDRIQFESGVTLFLDTYFNPEEKASLSGIVTFVPKSGELSKAGIKVGDEIFFDYRVVSDGDMLPGYGRTHKNEITINDRSEFFVSDYHIVGIKRGEEIIPYKGYVFTKPSQVKAKSKIIIPAQGTSIDDVVWSLGEQAPEDESVHRVEVVSVPEYAANISKGDIVWVRGELTNRCSFLGNPNDEIHVIHSNYLIAKE